ncbi:hypothetical protein CONCODRAFT_4358 [Conidiobolus coronatus NRRL 28638]|uniref:Cyanovirin-N domain-containing protein n=1 Tax=Conidiobolus coronatus (strain ATCC 28846 / CBS 209.66 / NRRL 28638) TaxID=796925 RepID=A0A137PCN9_CONC2|nr:hypothetical protein CONCODRAFT_4358 [Conidiobolus coronatus NRRL 28638]|eukprot:KXN72753.1 hypothetical protein CONCODRAFT_4358 [Conidiobolus coronatus NRRL 28638]
MKLLILLNFQLILTHAWTITLVSRLKKGRIGDIVIFSTDVVSNMGGTASTGCKTEMGVSFACEKGDQVTSSQGGYFIKDLKCNVNKCELTISTENVEFIVEAECSDENRTNYRNGLYDIHTIYCEFKRNFELYSDGTVEYQI